MVLYRTFRFGIVLTAFIALLNGCVPQQPRTSSEMAQPDAPSSQERGMETLTRTAPAGRTEQNIKSSPEFSTQQSIFGRVETTQVERIPVSFADVEFVQQRLNEYQVKLGQWLEISEAAAESDLAGEISERGAECVQLLERILTGYSLLLDRMQQSETVPVDKIATVDPRKMQQLDITFLESRCSEILSTDSQAQPDFVEETGPPSSFEETQKIINEQVNTQNYHEALIGYAGLLQDYPGQEPSISTQLNYGFALQYTGQVEEAAKHFSKMLASGELAVEPLSLQLDIADLLLASGNIGAAESYYENFILAHKSIEAEKKWAAEQLDFLRSAEPESGDMLAYMELLHEFQVYDYRIHSVALNEKLNTFITEHAGSPVAVSAQRLKTFTVDQLNSWFGRQLVKIDFLVTEKKFTEATDILKNMARYYLPADLQAVVQKTYYEVAQAEQYETENQRRIQEMELTEQWEAAVLLMDSQRFEEAIFAFEALMGTEYEEKANLKIVEAANLAAGQMRKEAASLFIRAGKTPDIEKKKELLLDSHRMLNEILARFPQTDLLDKVQQNIAILEEQMMKIDPAMLEELQTVENPEIIPAESPGPFSSQQ